MTVFLANIGLTFTTEAIMQTRKFTHLAAILAATALLYAGTASAETFCVKDNKPGDCFELQPIPGAHDTPAATPPAQAQPAAPAATSSTASTTTTNAPGASVNVGGDTVRSLAAVFPAPSTAPVPVAQACIVTRSTSAGVGFNLLQGATSEQYSDPTCVLQWLIATSTDATERSALRAELLRRLGVK